MRIISLLVITIALMPALAGCDGIAPLWTQASPETNIELDPIRKRVKLHNSKDVSLDLEKVTVTTTADGGVSFEINNLKVTDTASAVREANVAQLQAINQVTEALMAPWRDLAQRLTLLPTQETSTQAEPSGADVADGTAEP